MVKELDKEFTKKGEKFYQIEKTDVYYIYKRYINTSVCYEVFERKTFKINDFWRQYDTKGKYVGFDSFELYPKNEHFGSWAYCCNTLERAQELSKKFVNKKIK
jgi:hypothetical protein